MSSSNGASPNAAATLEALSHVEVSVCARVGGAQLPLAAVVGLAAGSIVTLDCSPDAPATVLVNGVPVASGDLVVTDDGVLAVEIVTVAP
jgi:flagellar motor switch/type III secretory pathway protein FliN